jgi:hypothetical protein
MNLFRRKQPAPTPSIRDRTAPVRDGSGYGASMPPLEFKQYPEVAERIEAALTYQRWARKAAVRAQERRWLEEADKTYTPEELAAIAADQARRVRAMGNK